MSGQSGNVVRLPEAAPVDAATLEHVLLGGDLAKMSPAQRLVYYRAVCDSLGLNPLTRPFQYLSLNGKLVLYASKDCTEQLRAKHNISVTLTDKQVLEDVYVVTARATRPDGRTDESTGAVAIAGLKGELKANALLRAETKAKRRVTLSIQGLGMLDDSEIGSIPDARPVDVDAETGEIHTTAPAANLTPPHSTGTPGLPALLKEHLAALEAEGRMEAARKVVIGMVGDQKPRQWSHEQLRDVVGALGILRTMAPEAPPTDSDEPTDDAQEPVETTAAASRLPENLPF